MQPGCLARKWGKRKEAGYFPCFPSLLNGRAHRPEKSVNARGTKNVYRQDHPHLAYKAPAQARLSSQAPLPLEPPPTLEGCEAGAWSMMEEA